VGEFVQRHYGRILQQEDNEQARSAVTGSVCLSVYADHFVTKILLY